MYFVGFSINDHSPISIQCIIKVPPEEMQMQMKILHAYENLPDCLSL